MRWLESSTTVTSTPRLWASRIALAMGAEVKLYAWTSTDCLAPSISRMMASVHPPSGEKETVMPSSVAAVTRSSMSYQGPC